MLQSLQGCRAAAAILVVLFHASGSICNLPKYFGHKPFGRIFDLGFAGVDFFFVLSGFIIMHVHAGDIGKPRALSAYLWKRFSRIYPAYWVVLALIVPVFFIAPSIGTGHERDAGVLIKSVLLWPQQHTVLSVAWTLVYEVYFYLLFGLLILLDRRLGAVLVLAWIGGILVRPWPESALSAFAFSTMNLRFLAGIGVAVALARWQLPLPRGAACTGITVFVCTGMFEAFVGPLSTWLHAAGYTLGSALTLAGLVQAERSGLIHPPRWLVYLGNASYSIYLVHFLGLSLLAKLAKMAQLDLYVPSGVLFALHVVGAIGIGCAFYHTIENPIHSWTKRFGRRAKAPDSAVPVPAPALSRAA